VHKAPKRGKNLKLISHEIEIPFKGLITINNSNAK